MIGTQTLIFIFFSLCGIGILLSLTAPALAQGKVLTWLGCLAAITLVLTGASGLLGGDTFRQPLWSLTGLTTLTLALDRLSAVFLIVTGLVLFPASIFAGGELRLESNQQNARAFTVLLLGLFASIALIFIAGDAVLFLLGWEVMSVLSYLLIVHHRYQENGRSSAGYLLLAMGEAGTLAAALSFLVLAINVNSVDFATLKLAASGLTGGARWAVFLF
jgi:formate hydrogenlyase subunit 3/multisubunit Na+/H+ antiporter MnhD subunit